MTSGAATGCIRLERRCNRMDLREANSIASPVDGGDDGVDKLDFLVVRSAQVTSMEIFDDDSRLISTISTKSTVHRVNSTTELNENN